MQSETLVLLRPDLAIPLLMRFAAWHYGRRPLRIIAAYAAYAGVFLEILSIPFLVRTLFAPWKNIADVYPKELLRVRAAAEAFALNATSRIAGAFIRLVAIVVGLAAQIILIVAFGAYLALWLMFPVMLLGGMAWLLSAFAR